MVTSPCSRRSGVDVAQPHEPAPVWRRATGTAPMQRSSTTFGVDPIHQRSRPRVVARQRRQHAMPGESIIEATSADGHPTLGEDEATPKLVSVAQVNLHSMASEDET